MANENVVTLGVPQPMYDVDAELNLMSNLEYVMRASADHVTDAEVRRVVEWFCDRYRMVPNGTKLTGAPHNERNESDEH